MLIIYLVREKTGFYWPFGVFARYEQTQRLVCIAVNQVTSRSPIGSVVKPTPSVFEDSWIPFARQFLMERKAAALR